MGIHLPKARLIGSFCCLILMFLVLNPPVFAQSSKRAMLSVYSAELAEPKSLDIVFLLSSDTIARLQRQKSRLEKSANRLNDDNLRTSGKLEAAQSAMHAYQLFLLNHSKKLKKFSKEQTKWLQSGGEGPPPQFSEDLGDRRLGQSIIAFHHALSPENAEKRTAEELYHAAESSFLEDLDRSERYIEILVKKYPQHAYAVRARYLVATIAFLRNQNDKAMAMFEALQKINKPYEKALALYMSAWSAMKNLRQGEKNNEEWHKRIMALLVSARDLASPMGSPNGRLLTDEINKDLALFIIQSGDASSAQRLYSGSPKIYPIMVEKVFQNLKRQGQGQTAIPMFQDLIKRSPDSPLLFGYYENIIELLAKSQNYTAIYQTLLAMNQTFHKESSNWVMANSSQAEIVKKASATSYAFIGKWSLEFFQLGRSNQELMNYGIKLADIFITGSISAPRELKERLAIAMAESGNHDASVDAFLKMASLEKPQSPERLKSYQSAASLLAQKAEQQNNRPKDQPPLAKPFPIPRVETELIRLNLRIIKEYPKTPYAVDRKFATGLIYYDYGHYEQALKLFEDIGVNHKDSQYAADARYNEMYYYFLTAKWEQAFQSSIKTLGEVLKIPKELDGNIKIIAKESGLKQAGIYSNAKQYAKADAIYQSLLSVFAKGNDHLDILGLSYLSIVEQGDVKRHFSMGKEILAKFKSHPLRPDIAFALGKTYYEMGNFAPAIRLTCPFSTHYIQHGKAEEALGICAQSNLNINRKKQAAEALLKQAQTFLEGEASKEAAIQAGQLFSGLGSRDLAQVSYQHFLTLPGTKDEGHQLQAQAFLWDLEGKIETGMEREAQWLIEKISTLSYDQRNSIDKMIHDKLLNYLKKQVEDEISMAKIEGKLNDELNKQKKRVGPIQKTYESITRLKDTGYNIAAEFEMGRMWKEWHKTLETYASTQSNKNRVNRELNLVKTKYELHLNRAAAFQERSDITSSYNKIIYNKLAELDPQKYRYKEIKHLDPLYTRRSVELGKWPPE